MEKNEKKPYISLQEAIEKMTELFNEDVERYGVEIPECFDKDTAIKALQSCEIHYEVN